MINERIQNATSSWTRRLWQLAFVALLAAVVVLEAVPELRAEALYMLTDGTAAAVTGKAEPVEADRILLNGSLEGGTDAVLERDKKVTILHGGETLYATSREGESVSELLVREGIAVGPLELVRVSSNDSGIEMDIASDFVVYETEEEAIPYTTVYATDYSIPKGETRVTREGEEGTRKVVYEIVFADGEYVSRQRVVEVNTAPVDEVVSTGTLVTSAASGDTIASVINESDGSGYLILKSGDSLHFSRTMNIRCTAYTSGVGKVGTITYTGTRVHVGCVAVDKRVIPLNTRMFITTANGSYTYGMAKAEDTGVYGSTVDLYMNSYNECIQFGVRSSVAYILD